MPTSCLTDSAAWQLTWHSFHRLHDAVDICMALVAGQFRKAIQFVLHYLGKVVEAATFEN